MDWVLFAVQWLHVLGGIFWFGGTLFLNVVVIPAVIRLPLERQRDVGRSLSAQLGRIVAPVAMATILLGILRGTVFGPLKSHDALVGTAYGLTWLVGLIAALATMLWGARSSTRSCLPCTRTTRRGLWVRRAGPPS